ncbi:MFS transporter [Polymorphospora rubra]|uniref:MFS transporter n=1 Tax=Polymorphospora rubra TaxID=338584 RepID=UPI0033D26723
MTSPPKPARRWLALTVLLLPVLLTSMDISILYLATPAIAADLAPSASELLWILDAYGFLLAGLLILMGNLGDRIGRRQLLLAGAVVFGVASLLAAYAPTPPALIAARALMGVGGATLMPSTLSLIRNMFDDPAERTRAIGLWTACFAGGSALGPVVGGLLLESFAWGSVFLINVPVVVLLLAVARPLLPEYRHAQPERLDLGSVALSFAAILPLVWAVKTAAEERAVTMPVAVAAATGAAAATAFAVRQRRLRTPLVEVRLFANRRFTGAVVAGALAMFSLVGLMLYNSQYLQLVLGLSPLVAALWLLPVLAVVAVTAATAPLLAARLGPAAVFGAGAGLAAIGMLVVGGTPVHDGLLRMIVGSVLVGAGISPLMTLATDVVVAAVDPERSGSASALSETANELGAATGIAVLGSIGAVVYRSSIMDAMPTDVPAGAADAVAANLGTAVEVADRLPPGVAEPLLALARQAFVDGLGAAALTGAAILALLAVVTPVLLRRGPAASAVGGRPER